MKQNNLLKVRSLKQSDIPQAQEIIRCWEPLFLEKKAQFLWSELDIRDEIEQQMAVGGFYNGQLVCFITYHLIPPVLEIRCLSTHPGYQGYGFMKHLISSLWDVHNDSNEVWLEVHENNANAKKLYEVLGFVEVARRSRYYSDGGSAILYKKRRA
ncbi:MAG TPA: GNAT family N-acetyltransferase [Pseudobdellovibrionaceae bacterium]|nr:GNAT family N-acetyltransferase [Pseudobdellovibrionaceae bacterium]